ncbi:MAG: hypothetical protein ABIN48_04835 [Ginsengibacter sp.]
MKKLFIHTPILIILLLFSMQGYSQTDTTKKTSEHPLLDKYYPRPKEDTVAKNPVKKSTGVEKKNAQVTPAIKPQTVEEKKLSFPAPSRPEFAQTIVKDSVAPVIAETPKPASISKPEIIADSKITAPASDSVKVVRAIVATPATTPPPKQSTSKIEGNYRMNRLGSSSPLYNTYEKNKNGAGSVTTMPKR